MAPANVKEYLSAQIRNISLIGHGGSGKTSLAESMVFSSGGSSRLGKVDDGSTIADYHSDEIERKISINGSLLHSQWNSIKVNIIDTPGYTDFTGEVLCGLSVTDLCCVVLKSVEGIEVGTELVWNYAKEMQLPTMLIVNKLDNDNSVFERTISAAKERLGNDVTVAQFPINEGLLFDSFVDVVSLKAFKYVRDGSGAYQEIPIPDNLRQKADQLHEEFIEKVAETNENLMNKYFDHGTLDGQELIDGLRLALKTRKIFPVVCTASTANVGVKHLLDYIVSYAPSPADLPPRKAIDSNTGLEVQMHADSSGQPLLFIFKTVSEAHVGDLSFFRVISGSVSAGLDLVNNTNGKPERLGQLFVMNGKERKEISKLMAGDLGAVVKLKDTHTNNTLASKASTLQIPQIIFPDPVIRMAIQSKAKGDEEKIANGLHHLHEEDPTFVIEVDPQLNQTLIGGQGELHLLIQARRLKELYGVEVELIEPKIPYKETMRAIVHDSEYKHKKQTGGRGQYGHVHLKLEPLPRGKGFEFEDAIVGGVVPGRFIPAVEKGIVATMQKGILAGFQVVDVKTTIFDGTYHSVDSDELSFKLAGSMAFKKGFLQGKPVILEPINEVEVIVPEEYMGDVMGDISGRRGKIVGMDSDGHFQKIKATIPMSELHKYATVLRSMTQGRGIYRTKFSHYEDLPKEIADKIIAEFGKNIQEEE